MKIGNFTMNKKILIPLILSSLFLCACGPKGETGSQGPQGQQGIPGEKGETGSSILTGTTNPSASIGKNGDTYVNVSTSTYFKKENGQWRVIFQDSSKNEQGLDFYLLDDGTYGVKVGKANYLSSIIIPILLLFFMSMYTLLKFKISLYLIRISFKKILIYRVFYFVFIYN